MRCNDSDVLGTKDTVRDRHEVAGILRADHPSCQDAVRNAVRSVTKDQSPGTTEVARGLGAAQRRRCAALEEESMLREELLNVDRVNVEREVRAVGIDPVTEADELALRVEEATA